jgi:predicted nucleic acid-binding protein
MKIDRLVDTNILIYAYDSASVFHRQAMTFLQDTDINLYITSKNISEFFAVLTKQDEPFSKIFLFYEDIIYNSTLLFPNQKSLDILENLLQKYQPRVNRVFDIEIVSICPIEWH